MGNLPDPQLPTKYGQNVTDLLQEINNKNEETSSIVSENGSQLTGPFMSPNNLKRQQTHTRGKAKEMTLAILHLELGDTNSVF